VRARKKKVSAESNTHAIGNKTLLALSVSNWCYLAGIGYICCEHMLEIHFQFFQRGNYGFSDHAGVKGKRLHGNFLSFFSKSEACKLSVC